MARIVLIAGFESFNIDLYRKAAELAAARCPGLEICVFSDRDLISTPTPIAAALTGADVFFASLMFDYDQVMWLRDRPSLNIPAKLKLAPQTSKIIPQAHQMLHLLPIGTNAAHQESAPSIRFSQV
jgi:Domain of unknown function (DUF3479)